MVHVPTCLVGQGLVRHSLVPDLLGPALAHHGLELGLDFLRASLDHLRIGHLGIDLRLQLWIRQGLYQRVLPRHQGLQCLEVVATLCPVNVVVWIKFEIHFAKFYTEVKKLSILRLPLIVSSQTLPGVPSNQTEQTGSIKG